MQQAQGRNATYLMVNTLVGAGTGLLFWFLLARIADLPPDQVGTGYAAISLGTIVGLLAKGGLDTALLRHVPTAGNRDGLALLAFAIGVGALGVAALVAPAWSLSFVTGKFLGMDAWGWPLVAAIGLLLVATWLQDAYFMAHGDARPILHRNIIFSGARMILPLPILALAMAAPIAVTWILALAMSAAFAAVRIARLASHPRLGRTVGRRLFLRSAARNVTGAAAEFLPGLLLVPIVLALHGAAAAAYFGMAWSAASLLFMGCAAISRSALAELMRQPADRHAPVLRRALRHYAAVVLPGAAAGIIVAPFVLAFFGSDYATHGAAPFRWLCISAIFVGPWYLYLALLRSRDHGRSLVWFPAAMVGTLLIAGPVLGNAYGPTGLAIGWLAANAPFGLYGGVKLVQFAKEGSPHATTETLSHSPHLE